ncbi:MAG: hypothetical protein EA369_09335 [Bradymonadales bacterium]|nr:MAG: hypothetical protein EA369_09335 [Bradymonadales bacterium]
MPKLRLGDILIAEKKIDPAQLKSALAYQRRWGKKLGDCIVDLGIMNEIEIMEILSRHLRLPLIDLTRLDSTKVTKEILNSVSVQISRKKRVVPIALREIRNKRRLVIATSDPTNYETFDEIQFKVGLPIVLMIAPDSDIDWFIRKYYLNEGDALPENYISAISMIKPNTKEESEDPDRLETDPITNIFFDEEFTGMSHNSYRPLKDKDDKGDKKK